MKIGLILGITLGFLGWLFGGSGQADYRAEPSQPLIHYPEKIDKDCNKGRARLYDQCGSQTKLFAKALERANEEGKTLLVWKTA